MDRSWAPYRKKEQLLTAQNSGLGVPLGPIYGAGQTDDLAQLSNNIHKVRLSFVKYKLLVFNKKDLQDAADYRECSIPSSSMESRSSLLTQLSMLALYNQ